MNTELLTYLESITTEEQAILDGQLNIRRDLYTSKKDFIIDSQKLLEKGRLIELRLHTRFAHFPRHRHDYVEMVYMCSGSTTHIINDSDRITLQEGDLLFLNQNATQEILPAGLHDIAVNFIILPEFFDRSLSMIEEENILRDFLISTLAKDSSPAAYLHFQAKDILPVQNLLENMIWTLIHKKSGTNTINQTTMGLLFMNLSTFAESINQNAAGQYEQNMVFSVLKYIETHYKNASLTETMGLLFMNLSTFAESINQNAAGQYEQNMVFSVLKYIETHYKNASLTDICTEYSLPPYYISRLLKKFTGSNFKNLLQQRRLQQAAYLLSQTTLSVEAVMDAIGYENSSYFYRKFREKYGCSPAEFREK